jgi:preprotein translocase subunit SecA
VLNAKNHAREAEIVAQAGQPGTVTIATNMAGRGTDIKLGPGVVWVDEAVIKSLQTLDMPHAGGPKSLRQLLVERPCGLHVLGSERHESRRIDRQLRGRCARQGDPGSSRFYISLEDDLMRLFGSERISGIMSRLGMQEGEALEHRWLNRSVETAQRRVEQQNFSIRKRTLEYDDVMNKQREVIYAFRGGLVRASPEEVRARILDVINDLIVSQCESLLANPKESRADELAEWVLMNFPVAVQAAELAPLAGQFEAAGELIFARVEEAYAVKCSFEDPRVLPIMERQVALQAIDTQWQEYLRAMDELRHGVGLRAYGQRDPLIEYKREAFSMFEELMNQIKAEIAQTIFRASTSIENLERMMGRVSRGGQRLVHDEIRVLGSHPDGAAGAGGARPPAPLQPAISEADFDQAVAAMLQPKAAEPVRRDLPKVGRNDDCPCGSGKKYKKCCGKT